MFKKEDKNFVLKDISIQVNSGEMLAIAGPVGIGKSMFLQSILNEIPCITGNLKVTGSLFYVSQEPWLFPATLKENILLLF